jgi:hypothetical protein
LLVVQTAVERKPVTTRQDKHEGACPNEHGVTDLLTLPPQPLLERPGAFKVCDAQGDKTDPLLLR